ncbi:unnamed protein product, partial [Heterosigma akashiwo]
ANSWENQPHVTSKMREILVDWVVMVHASYNLSPATLFLAVNVLDRFASVKPILRTQLQLVGVTSLMIAAKYYDVKSPTAKQCAYLTGGAYSVDDIFEMERNILVTVDFNLSVPTVQSFLSLYLAKSATSAHAKKLSNYIAEQSLQFVDAQIFLPSLIAASSVVVACKLTGDDT